MAGRPRSKKVLKSKRKTKTVSRKKTVSRRKVKKPSQKRKSSKRGGLFGFGKKKPNNGNRSRATTPTRVNNQVQQPAPLRVNNRVQQPVQAPAPVPVQQPVPAPVRQPVPAPVPVRQPVNQVNNRVNNQVNKPENNPTNTYKSEWAKNEKNNIIVKRYPLIVFKDFYVNKPHRKIDYGRSQWGRFTNNKESYSFIKFRHKPSTSNEKKSERYQEKNIITKFGLDGLTDEDFSKKGDEFSLPSKLNYGAIKMIQFNKNEAIFYPYIANEYAGTKYEKYLVFSYYDTRKKRENQSWDNLYALKKEGDSYKGKLEPVKESLIHSSNRNKMKKDRAVGYGYLYYQKNK